MQLEAEAQAAERYYSGEAGAAEPAPLIHAPLPATGPVHDPDPDLTATAQLATALMNPTVAPSTTQEPQHIHAPFDPATRSEVGRIATESARHVVAEWTNPALHPQGGGTRTAPGATSGPPRTPAAGAATAGAAAFDREARRQELTDQTLAALNASRYGDQLTQLDSAQEQQIERMLDDEEMRVTGTVSAAAPEQHYEKNSKEAWVHALTGTNAGYGLGLTGFKEEVGSEKSWWGGRTGDERSLSTRLADSFGVTGQDADKQFDTDSWWGPDRSDSGRDPDTQPGEDDWKYGRPNPDKAAFDVNKIDLDELASRLYDRVRSRLRLELLVDRERAGLLTDFR
jgi:hypothetical protein